MLAKHLKYLSDPQSREDLKINIINSSDKQIKSAILISHNNWYPVIGGIPRILIGNDRKEMLHRNYNILLQFKLPKKYIKEIEEINKSETNKFDTHQIQTADSFAFEWNNIYKENTFERNNYLHFLSPFVKEKDIAGKIILDAGCGSGRFTKQASLMNAKVIIGADLGETVEKAYELTKHLDNVLIIQADIYKLPFKRIFDLVHSIGVLHHLPQPESGFQACSKTVRKNGKILIWVYNRHNNNRALYFYEPLRSISRHIPKNILYKLCYLPAAAVHFINILTKNMDNPPFGYYRNFPFNMKLNDAFDVLATPKSNYYLVEEITGWFSNAKLRNIRTFEHPEAGITAIGSYAR